MKKLLLISLLLVSCAKVSNPNATQTSIFLYPPPYLAVNAINATSVTLHFSNHNALRYQVIRSTTESSSDGTTIYSGSDLSFQDTGLTPNTTYFYFVKDIYPPINWIRKKIAYSGDSFVDLRLPQPLINSLNGLTEIYSNGVSGGCLTHGTNNAEGDGISRTPGTDNFAALLSQQADIYFMEWGTNDGHYLIPLSDSLSTDYTNFYGALKYVRSLWLKHLITDPNTFLYYTTPSYRGDNRHDGSLSTFATQDPYSEAIIDIFGKVKNTFVNDALHNCGITPSNVFSLTQDGVHPLGANSIGITLYGMFEGDFLANPSLTNITAVTTSK